MQRPDFSFEEDCPKGCIVIGVDEVGRGAIAGPVVAGAVSIFNLQFPIFNDIGIDDSKRLTPAKREKLAKIIKKNAMWGIGEASVAQINRLGISKATMIAMRKAISNLKFEIRNLKTQKQTFVLVDAFYIKFLRGVGLKNQKAIIKGDQKSISIAAASIIAKVHRDKLMSQIHKKYRVYKRYKFYKHKGYGTKEHWEAIEKFGVSKFHRKKFVY